MRMGAKGRLGWGWRWVAAAAALLPATGCSFLVVNGPPPYAPAPGRPISCTTESAAPALDTVVAVALAGLAVPLLLAKDACDSSTGEMCIDFSEELHMAGAMTLGAGLLGFVSGASGRAAIERCRAAVARADACPSPDPATCGRLGFDAQERAPQGPIGTPRETRE